MRRPGKDHDLRRSRLWVLLSLALTCGFSSGLVILAAPDGAVSPRAAASPESTTRYQPVSDAAVLRGQPYHRFSTEDALGRRIVFYLSDEPAGGAPLPLVVYVHGSGCLSHFVEVDGRLQGRNGHSTIADVVRGRARLVIVEKPGVSFLDAPSDPGGATHASPEFRTEHTLERWTEAVHAALLASRKLPGVLPGRALVVGHSEGGLVAAKLAAEDRSITHVAVLAGGGPTQLFDLVTLARRGDFFRSVSNRPDERVEFALNHWSDIQANPQSADTLFFGHPYRRWSSFLSTSTLEQLLKTDARIYSAQGAEDRAVTRESFDLLRTELLARGKKAELDLVGGADHSFAIRAPGGSSDGWAALFERIMAWFTETPASARP